MGEAGARLTTSDGPIETASSYRPHLDGLRALAVYLVVVYHAGSSQFSGGFIGVDVFFVLSGYLVTQLLMRDIVGRGSIELSRFYSRRFRRLLPAAFVTLIVSALVYTAIASPIDVVNAVGQFRAAFLYSANWYFIHQSRNYFAANISTSPVLHFWSLAVEEQFYLVWPLLLGSAFLLTRRMERAKQFRVVRIAVVVAALASMVWALSLRTTDLTRAYYGTDTRAYELLAGALVALAPAFVESASRLRRSMRVATVASIAAVIVLASSLFDLDAIERGVVVTIAVCLFLVAVEAGPSGLVKRVLSSRLCVYLGRISYGTYLWHWIVILVILTEFHISTIATIGLAALVATALAALSFEVLEHPVRTWTLLDRHRRLVIATGLAVSGLSALVLVPGIVTPANAAGPIARATVPAHLTPRPASLNLQAARRFPRVRDCVGKPVSRCRLVGGSGLKVLLVGDSQAIQLNPLFVEIAKREHLQFYADEAAGCPWQRALRTGFEVKNCEQVKQDLYTRLLPVIHPDIVVAAELDYGTPGTFTAPLWVLSGRTASADQVKSATAASVRAFRAVGTHVVLVESLPIPVNHTSAFNPYACLAVARILENCRYEVETNPTPLEQLYRTLAEQDAGVFTLSLDQAVCPLIPTCDPIVNGQMVKIDPLHLTVGFSASLAPQVDASLKSAGILPVGSPPGRQLKIG